MPDPRQIISTSISDLSHGITIAAGMMDTHGEDAAVAWFHEHERMPTHSADACLPLPTTRPMRLSVGWSAERSH